MGAEIGLVPISGQSTRIVERTVGTREVGHRKHIQEVIV